MMQRRFIFLAMFWFFLAGYWSCTDDFGEQSVDPGAFLPGDGVFILNEGNFNQGNGSISFYNYADGTISHDVFRTANDRPLGDLPASMFIGADRFFISVNHSGRIETGDPGNLVSMASLQLTPSPRQILVIGPDRVVVSDLQSPEIVIFDPKTGLEVSRIITGRSTEALLMSGSRLFASNWSSYYVSADNRYIMVADATSSLVTDSVLTGLEPQSMVTDFQGTIWVLCSGGWDNSELPVLMRFDPATLEILEWFDFPDKNRSPSHLCLNPTLDTLYFLDHDLYQMPVDAGILPGQAFILSGMKSFYALGVDPVKGDIFISDAVDYQQDGTIWRYGPQGRLLHQFSAGIIPGAFCFN